MRSRTPRVFLTAGTLVLGLAVSLVPALAQDRDERPTVRVKSDSQNGSKTGRAAGRELAKPEVANGVAVVLAPDRKAVREGGKVFLTVRLERGKDVGHVPFHLNYDPTVLRFERAREGGFMNGDGQNTAFMAAGASAGSAVVVGLSRLGKEEGVTGTGELCVLEFTAVGRGDAKLGFSRASVRDPQNRAIEAEFRATSVTVR